MLHAIKNRDECSGCCCFGCCLLIDDCSGLIYWRSPRDWGEKIHAWARENNHVNSVCTFYEITNGDETISQGNFLIDYFLIDFADSANQ